MMILVVPSKKACDNDLCRDRDAMHLMRAAKVVRIEMFKQKYLFDGSFTEESPRNIVPQSLLALVNNKRPKHSVSKPIS